MLRRIGDMINITGIELVEGNAGINLDATFLHKLWKETEQFLYYKYASHNINIDSSSKYHCYRYTLNKVEAENR